MTLLLPYRTPIEDGSNRLSKEWERAFRYVEATYGVFVQVPYAAALFTGSGLMTWTVEAADAVTLAYTRMGNRLELQFVIRAAVVGGTPDTTLRITIPGTDARGNALVAAHDATAPVYYNDAGTKAIGVARVVAGGATVEIQKPTAANWTAGANGVEGQIVLEVE